MRERGGRIDDVMSEEEGSKDGPRRERIWGAPPPPPKPPAPRTRFLHEQPKFD